MFTNPFQITTLTASALLAVTMLSSCGKDDNNVVYQGEKMQQTGGENPTLSFNTPDDYFTGQYTFAYGERILVSLNNPDNIPFEDFVFELSGFPEGAGVSLEANGLESITITSSPLVKEALSKLEFPLIGTISAKAESNGKKASASAIVRVDF